MSNPTMAWTQWLEWVNQVEAEEVERQRKAPPLNVSDLSQLENASFADYAVAIRRHSHLAEQGKKLLAEFLHLNTHN